MVAIIGGSGLGLSESSLAALGSRGVSCGAAGQGRNGERTFVNVASGNLVLQDLDGLLVGLGSDVASVRTYNSQGQVDFTNQDGWWEPQYKSVVRLDANTLLRTDSDGSSVNYAWNSNRQRYEATYSPGEAVSFICVNGDGSFTWTDGATGCTENFAGSRGFIQSSTDASKANICTYTYTGNLLTQVKTSDGETVTYGYQGNNLVSLSTTILDGGVQKTLNQISYTYDSQNRLSTVAVQLNPDGQVPSGSETLTTYTTTYTYDGSSTRVASITQSDGSSQSFTYVQVNGGYRIASVTDGAGKVTQFAYDTANSKTTVTDPLGVSTVYQYDATSGQLTQIRMGVTASNANGLTQVSYAYNGLGDVTSLTDGQGRTVTMTYDTSGNLLRQVDAAGDTHEWTYTTDNQVQTETVYAAPAAGTTAALVPQVTRYIYAASNGYQLRFVIGADGAVTEHRYNAQGLRTSTLSHGARYDVSGLAQNAAPTEASMTTWAAAQNAALCQRTDFTYDFRGQLQTQTTHASGLTAYSITQGTNPPTPMTDSTTQYVYDQRGNLLQTITPDTRDVTQMIYDGLGRIVSAVEKGDGAVASTTVYQYDDANGKTSVTQTNGLTTTSAYDKTGRLVSVTQLSGSTTLGSTTYAYDADGHLLMTMDASGLRTWMLYDAAGQKVADINGLGNLTEYVYDRSDRLTQTIRYATAINTASLVDVNGNPLTAYGSSASLATLRPSASSLDVKNWYLYDTAGRLAWQVDGLGYVTETTYDGVSRVLSVSHLATARSLSGLGNGVGVVINPASLVRNSSLDRTVTSIYSDEGLLRGVVDGEGYLTEYRYNGAGQQVQSIAYKNVRIITTADLAALTTAARNLGAAASLVTTADPDAIQTFTYYNERGQVAGQVDGLGYLTEYVYDSNGRPSQTIRYASMVIATPTWNSTLASLRPVCDMADQVSTSTYDALGRLETQTNVEGTVTKYTYDTMGQLIETATTLNISDKRSLLQRYDVQGRVVAELSGEGAAQLTGSQTQAQIDAIWSQYGLTYAYDAAGRRISSTDGLGQRTVFFYDDAGHLTHTVNAKGEVNETMYDALGRVSYSYQYATRMAGETSTGLVGGLLSATANADGKTKLATAKAGSTLNNQTRYDYNVASRLIKTTDALSGSITRTYNAFGEVLTSTQTVSRVTGKIQNLIVANTYDRRGLLTSSIEDSGLGLLNLTTRSTYDAFGRLTDRVDGNGKTTHLSYDKLGRVVLVTDPLSNGQSTSYDAFNRVLNQTDALGKTTSYSYDSVNLSMTVVTPEGVSVTTTHSRLGQIIRVVDGNGNLTTYDYDKNGQVTSTKRTVSGAVVESKSHYDALGRMDWSQDADGNQVNYAYDAANRLMTRTVVMPGGTNLVTKYDYTAKGETLSVTDAKGIVTKFSYDKKSRVLTQIVDSVGLKLTTTYTYDDTDHVLTIKNPGGVTTQYTYDALGRRTSESVDPGNLNLTTQYTYDSDGNVVAVTDAKLNVSRSVYDDAGRLILTVDGAGNACRMDYDKDNRVTTVTRYTQAISLSGLALQATVTDITGRINAAAGQSAVVENRVYDQDGRLTYTVDGAGGVTKLDYDQNGNVLRQTHYANVIDRSSWTLDTVPAVTADSTRDVVVQTVYDGMNRAVYSLSSVGDGTRMSVTSMSYDGNGNLIARRSYANTIAKPAMNVTVSAFSSAVLAIQDDTKDLRNQVMYDAANRAVFNLSSAADGSRVSVVAMSYDANGNLITQRSYANTIAKPADTVTLAALTTAVTAVKDDTRDALVRVMYDGANRALYRMNSVGDGTRMSVVAMSYDANGNLISQRSYANTIAKPADTVTLAALTTAVTAVKDDTRDARFRRVYDAANRLIWQVDGTGSVTRQVYDSNGNVIKQIAFAMAVNPETWTLGTDPTSSAADRVTQMVYDAANRLRYTVNPLGCVSETVYDALGNAVTRIAYSTSITIPTATNDVSTALPTSVGANDRVTRAVFDAANRLAYTIDAQGDGTRMSVVAMSYDGNGNLIARRSYANTIAKPTDSITASVLSIAVLAIQDDTKDSLTQVMYDAANRAVFSLSSAGDGSRMSVVAMSYDGHGNLISRRSYANTIAKLAMNATVSALSSAVLAIQDDTKDLRTQVIYDAANRAVFNLSSAGDGSRVSVVAMSYDGNGNLITQRSYANTIAKPADTVTLSALTTAVTAVKDDTRDALVRVMYDGANRALYRLNSVGDGTRMSVVAMSYDGNGNLITRRSYANTIAKPADTVTLAALTTAVTAVKDDTRDALVRVMYDAANRAVFSLSSAADGTRMSVVAMSYDANGNLINQRSYANTIAKPADTVTLAALTTAVTAVKDDTRDARFRRVYDAANRLIWQVDGTGSVTRQVYDSNGNVIKQIAFATAVNPETWTLGTDPTSSAADHVTQMVYDADDRLTFTVDGLGAVTQNTYDGRGNLIRQLKSANALTNRASLDGKTAPEVQGSAADRLTQFGYDADNRLTFAVDALGAVTRNVYDALGNLTKQIKYGSLLANRATWDGATAPTTDPTADPDRVTLMSYDLLGRLTYVVDAAGDVTQNVYDVHGNVIAQVAYQSAVAAPTASSTFPTNLPSTPGAGDRVTLTAYDGANRKLYSVDGGVYVTAYVYDGLGQLSSSTLYMKAVSGLSVGATASTITAQITAQSIAQSSVDETTRFVYDAAGRLTSSTDACGKTESYVYDAMGNKIQFTNKTRSAVWTYAYDQVGRLIQEIDPAVNVTTMSADAATGVMTTNPLGNRQIVTQLVYDALGNLVSRTEGGLLNADQSIDLSKSRTTSYAYDALGHQITITYPSAGVYNVADLANLNTDGAGAGARTEIPSPTLTTQVVYDLFGEAVANIDTGRNVSTKTYNNLGQVDYEVDAMGYVTYYGRNVFGDVTTLTRYSITTTVNPSASSLTPTTAVGAGIPSSSQVKAALVAANDTASRTITTLYDQLGRACQVTQPTTWVNPSGTNATGYLQAAITKTSYNAFGEVFQTKVLASGTATTPTWAITTNYYDQRGHLTGTVIPVDLATQTYYVTTQTYDAAGNLSGRTEYANALTSWAPPTSSTASLTLPTADLLNDRTTQYTYDQCNRKTSEKIVHVDFSVYNPTSHGVTGASSDATTSYTYDAVGNQISTQDAGSNVTYTYYDALGRITAVAAPSRDITFGGITSAGVPLTVFKRDNYGNVTVKTEYAKGAAGDPLNGYTANPDTSASSKDRTTLTQYDARGNAIQTQDPNGVEHFMSYDALGRLAKVWQGVTRYTPTDAELNGPTLRLGEELGGTELYSADLHYRLVVESDRLAILDRINGRTIWTSNTTPRPTLFHNTRLVFQTNGDLVLSSTMGESGDDDRYDPSDPSTTIILWSSGTAGQGGTTLKMGTDGNLALYNASGAKVWGTNVSVGPFGSKDTPGFVTHTLYTVFQYDALGRQTDIITPASTNVLNDRGILLVQSQATVGSITTHMNYNAFGEMTDRGNCATGTTVTYQESFRYDAAGRLWYTNSGDGTEKIFLYDLLGNQTAQISSSGLGTTDGKGLDISSATLDALNQQVMLGSSNIDAQGDANLRRTSYQRDLLGRVLHQVLPSRKDSNGTDSFKPVIDQTFDRWGNVLTQTLPHDPTVMVGATTYVYNKYNQVIQQTQPQVAYGANGALRGNPTTLMYYDILGRQVAIRDANLNVNGQVWGGGGQLVQEIHADADATGGTITHYYDAFGDQVRLVDAENHVITYAYDNLGHNTTITHPNMSVAGYSTPQDITTTMTYDEVGNKVTVTDGTGAVIKYAYDLRGNMIRSTDQDGYTTLRAFDAQGRKTAEQDANLNVSTWSYDYFGQLNSRAAVDLRFCCINEDITALVYTQTCTYDNARQLQTQTSGGYLSGQQNLAYTYDAAGQLIRIVDAAEGQTTTYTYTASGQHVTETVTQTALPAAITTLNSSLDASHQITIGTVYQDQYLGYDALGRLESVQAWKADGKTVDVGITYTYDLVGNKYEEKIQSWTEYIPATAGTPGHYVKDGIWVPGTPGTPAVPSTLVTKTLDYAYDSMNRQIVVDSSSHDTSTFHDGHLLAYDHNGNRIKDTFLGTQVDYYTPPGPWDKGGGGPTYSSHTGTVTQDYHYDAMDRLTTVVLENPLELSGMNVDLVNAVPGSTNPTTLTLDTRQYDGASRVVSSGPHGSINRSYLSILLSGNTNLSGATSTTTTYDRAGRTLTQSVSNETDSSKNYTIKYSGTSNPWASSGYLGYDGVGNVQAYEMLQGSVTNHYSMTSRFTLLGYQEQVISSLIVVPSSSSARATTYEAYDANGFLNRMTQTADSSGLYDTRVFVNNASGMALWKYENGNVLKQLIINGEVVGIYGKGADPNAVTPPAPGTAPAMVTQSNFNLAYTPVSNAYPSPTAGMYTVQVGDSLQGIALSAYGDSSLWYLIADANGLSGDSDLHYGQILTIPTNVGSVHNSADTHTPYDPSKIVGSKTPSTALPPPSADSGGCGGIGMIIMIVVAIVVTIYTAGAASAFFGGGFWGAVAGGAIGAAAGSIASQAVGIAIGAQAEFSWDQVGKAAIGGAISGGVGAGLGDAINTGSAFVDAAAKAAISNAMTQGTEMMLGMQKSFNWMSVATSAVGAGVGAEANKYLSNNTAFQKAVGQDFGGKVVQGTLSGFAAGMSTAVLHGGRIDITQVATDAFGNALGSSIAGEMEQSSQQEKAAEKAKIWKMLYGNPLDDAIAQGNQIFSGAKRSLYYSNLFGTSGDQTGIDWSKYGFGLGGFSPGAGSLAPSVQEVMPTSDTRSFNHSEGGVNYSYIANSADVGVVIQGQYREVGTEYDSTQFRQIDDFGVKGNLPILIPINTAPGNIIDLGDRRVVYMGGTDNWSVGTTVEVTASHEEDRARMNAWDRFWDSPRDPIFNSDNFGWDFWKSLPKGGLNFVTQTLTMAGAYAPGNHGFSTMLTLEAMGWDGAVFHPKPGNDGEWLGMNLGNLAAGTWTGQWISGLGSLSTAARIESSMMGARPMGAEFQALLRASAPNIAVNETLPGMARPLRSVNPAYPPNPAAVDSMGSSTMRQMVEATGQVDCSEIAEQLLEASGGQGRILNVKPNIPRTLNVFENGQMATEQWYHQVFTDGKYVFDPRLTPTPIPKGDWLQHIKNINPSGVTITH